MKETEVEFNEKGIFLDGDLEIWPGLAFMMDRPGISIMEVGDDCSRPAIFCLREH
jgi:hypothetical protein